MNAAPLDSHGPPLPGHPDEPSWSAARWIISITLVFGLHVGLIYGLGDRKPLQRRAIANAVSLRVATVQSELQQLEDPTLFALPHLRGFAGAIWLRHVETNAAFRWTEPPRLLALRVERLGEFFLQQAETSAPARRQIETIAAPMTTVLSPMDEEIPRGPALLRVNGGLAGRPLRNAPATLPRQPAQENLTNSVVQVLVDGRGQVISATLMTPGSGGAATDQDALRISRNLRFSASRDAASLTVGKLVFEWQTLPATNAPAPKP